MQAAAPPPGAPPQPVGAPSDERALKHHYFFQKLYTPSAIDGDDDICFGTGYRAPKVPIVLQSIPEGKDAYSYFNTHGFKEQGDEDESRRKAMLSIVDAFVTENLEVSKYSKQYSCRIDGVQFPNHAAAVTHMHDVHKNRIEVLLFDLLQDMEQNHMGYFFSKLLYSDFIFPSPIFHSKELSSEFPSVLAPDLERLEPGKAKPAANGKPEKKKQSKPNGASAATPGASFGFTEEELQQMERRLFSGRFLVDASTEAKLSAKSPAPTPVPVPVAAVPSATPPTSASAATAAAVAAATAKGKAEAAAKDSAAAAEKAAAKKKEKEAKEKAEKERAEKEARDQAAREKQAADKAAKEKADKERADKAEKERERQRREAERKQAEKERLEKERAAKAAADAAERERVRLESTAEFKRVKKQMEDELMADIFEEVITDFMSKLAARTLQEQRREDEKTKQEQAERAAAEAEAQHEQDVTAKEKRNIEKKLLRDLKKIEGDRVIDDLIDEVVFEENLLLAPDLLQEMRREVLAAASAAPVAATPAPAVSRRPSAAPAAAVQAPLPPHPVPLASAAAANASWNPPAATAQRGAQPAARGAPVPVAVPAATRPTAPPTMLRSGGKAAAGKAPAMAVPAYQPFGLAAAVTPPSSLSASAESGEGADEFDEYLVQERIKLNLDTDEHDADDDHLPAQPSAAAANAANIFGLFSSKLTEPVTGPPSANAAAAPFVPSPRRVGAGGGKPSAAAEPSVPQAVEPPSRQGGMSPPPPPLRSVPEDFGFDPQLSVTCYNLPSIVPVNRGEMLGFFRDIPIAVAPPDFAPKVQVLRGAESGACYVQFENPAAVQKAMTRDRLMLRDRSIRVVPAQGLRTSNSGQRFALNVQTRNAQLGGAAVEPPVAPFRSAPSPVLKAPEPVHAGTAPTPPLVEPVKSLAAIAAAAAEQPVKSAAEVEAPAAGSASAFTGFGLPALIPDFRPVAAPTSQHSLSSLLNTEQDTIVTPFDRKAKSGAAIGSAVGAPGKAPGPVSKAPGPGSLGLMAPAPAPAPAASLDDEDANNDETFASSFGGDGTFDPSGQFVTGGPKAPDPRAGGPPPGAMAMMGGGPPMHMGHPQHPGAHSMYAAQLPLPLPAPNAAYMRAASPPAPQQYRGPPGMNARVVTPPPPGFHVPLALPMQAPGGFAPPKGMAYPPPGMVPPQQQQETRQPTVAPASSAEAAFMDRFL